VRWLIATTALGAALLAIAAQPARATNECRGLQVCVRVAGPWVVVPSALASPRPRVEFQLSCPRGYVIGGLDAELSDRAIDVGFVGKLGSPVGPGVTTLRSALFGATYVGASARAPSFRPHLGCLPAAGGGSGPVPYRRATGSAAAFPPGDPTVLRVRTIRLRPGNVRAVAACGVGERLLSGWHAIGFYTATAPSAALMQSVGTTRRLRAGRVLVNVRGGAELSSVRAIVQVGAVCAGGK
jgi:hypothetical protein